MFSLSLVSTFGSAMLSKARACDGRASEYELYHALPATLSPKTPNPFSGRGSLGSIDSCRALGVP